MITLAILVFIITFLLDGIIYKRYKYFIRHNIEDAWEKAIVDNFLLFSFAFLFNFISVVYIVIGIKTYLP